MTHKDRPRSSIAKERRLSTGFSAHSLPVDEDDTLLTTDISSKLHWRQLNDCFLSFSAEKLEAADHTWIRGFGVALLGAYKVKLQSEIELLRREQSLRHEAALSAANLSTEKLCTNGEEEGNEMHLDDLFTENAEDVQKREETAQREIQLLHELHKASWQWIEAHLDHYAAVWEERMHERGKGDVAVWGEICRSKRERDTLENEILQLRGAELTTAKKTSLGEEVLI